jgi:hypothetical protein
VDFLRPRAIPALIAALGFCLHASADCSSLDGTYQFGAAGSQHTLDDLTLSPARRKLYRVDAPGTAPGTLNPTQALRMAKRTTLAVKASLTYSSAGTNLRFVDASGATLAEMGIDMPVRWKCDGQHLWRGSERTAGLGDAIRTEKVEEILERNAAGDLVYRETVTVIDPPGGKPAVSSARFPAAH